MFPHTITIFNIVDGQYIRKVVSDVFYVSEKIISQEGNGEKYTNTHRVIFSKDSLSKYIEKSQYIPNMDVFTLKTNDIIVKGIIGQITDIKELNDYDYFRIKTISDNSDYGSSFLRNIEVTD